MAAPVITCNPSLMANPSDTPTRLTPAPPNLPGYTPPVPSFATAPALPPVVSASDAPTGTPPPLESAPRLNIHLAQGPDLD